MEYHTWALDSCELDEPADVAYLMVNYKLSERWIQNGNVTD